MGEDWEEPYPCDTCGRDCDIWEMQFCCKLCIYHYGNDTPCENCDPYDI